MTVTRSGFPAQVLEARRWFGTPAHRPLHDVTELGWVSGGNHDHGSSADDRVRDVPGRCGVRVEQIAMPPVHLGDRVHYLLVAGIPGCEHVRRVTCESLEVRGDTDVHRWGEGRSHGARVHGAGVDQVGEAVVGVVGDDDLLDR